MKQGAAAAATDVASKVVARGVDKERGWLL